MSDGIRLVVHLCGSIVVAVFVLVGLYPIVVRQSCGFGGGGCQVDHYSSALFFPWPTKSADDIWPQVTSILVAGAAGAVTLVLLRRRTRAKATVE